MGMWKRVSEKTKQAFGLKANAADWKPTSNARNLAMIDEARKFSKQLKHLHRELKDMEARIEGHFGVLRSVLGSPLPRVYELSDKGALPIEKESSMVGSGVAFEVFVASAGELKTKLQQEVLHPLDQWQAAYRMIKSRNGKCEELRLELDAKRREATAMTVNLERMKTKAQSTDTDKAAEAPTRTTSSGSPNKFEDAEFKLQKEEDKVSRLTQRYRDIEEEVYSALLTLINDTKVLKQYAASALVVFQAAFAQAYTAFSDSAAGVLAAPGSATPAKSMTRNSHDDSPAPSKVGPDTPEQPSTQPAPPAWYNEARQKATTMQYDSDDDN